MTSFRTITDHCGDKIRVRVQISDGQYLARVDPDAVQPGSCPPDYFFRALGTGETEQAAQASLIRSLRDHAKND